MYQALYRKYRPQSFDEIFGQDNIVATFKNAISNNKLSHAYLFTGPRGTGKTSIAKIVANTINCQAVENFKPCNKCVFCTQKETDIIEIDAASNNGVDEIRELKNKISLVPAVAKYKIYIIDEVHMLTISAFNALLKTLEEPPAHVIFILATTDPQKLPLTILSRCQRFDFKRIDEKAMYERLSFIAQQESIKISDNALWEIIRIAEGGLRDAINLLDQVNSYSDLEITLEDIHSINGTVTQYEIEKIFNMYIDNKLDLILKLIDTYNQNGKNLVKLTQEFILFLRNTLIFKKSSNYLIENGIDCEPYKKISKILNQEMILKLLKDLNTTKNEMKISSNPKLELELLFIKNIDGNVVENNIEKINNIDLAKKQEKVINNPKAESLSANKNFKKIRIENTLALFDKTMLKDIQSKLPLVKNMLLNQKYSQYASLILDGILKAASDKNLIFMFKINSDVDMFNENLKIIEEIIFKTLELNLKPIAVNTSEWEVVKNEFNTKKKKYVYIEEIIEKQEKEINKNSTLIEEFKEIVEYR